MIYTFTANPSLDYITHTDIVPNALNRGKNDIIRPGGKGINVSLMLTNLGCENTAIVPVAGETGNLLETMLKNEIHALFIRTEGSTRINTKALGKNGVTEINGQGVSISAQALKEPLKKIGPDDIFVISGSFVDYSLLDEIVAMTNTKKIIFDIPRLEFAIKHKPFVIKPNLFELEQYFDTQISVEEAGKYADRLMENGCRNVLVSLGENGAYFCNKNHRLYMSAPKGECKNAIGAGDSMAAGLIYSIINNIPVDDAVAFAVACGSATAFKGDIADKNEAEAVLNTIVLHGGIHNVS